MIENLVSPLSLVSCFSSSASVSMFYRNDTTVEPYPLQLPGCSLDCPLEEFVTITKLSISDDRDKECQLPSGGRDTGEFSLKTQKTAKTKRKLTDCATADSSFVFLQKWSSVWPCLAVCSSSSSSSSSAWSVGKSNQTAAGDTSTWSTRMPETNPDKSTNSSLGDLQTCSRGTAATMKTDSESPASLFWARLCFFFGTHNDSTFWVFIQWPCSCWVRGRNFKEIFKKAED